MKIGVISDTHNYVDPKILTLLSGVDHILHGGDVGTPMILNELRGIAPVTAVSGNTDEPMFQYPLTQAVELGRRKFLLHHIVNPRALDESLKARISRDRPDVVVFGHTHKPFCETVDGVLFFNPGYAGRSRFGMDRTLAILHSTQAEIRAEYLALT
jgi:putative phosphoesterase